MWILIFRKPAHFQQKVWTALTQIPLVKTISYLDLALKVGTEKAHSCSGTGQRQNPIPIIVPCHRGDWQWWPTGYALGLPMKRYLLNLKIPEPLPFKPPLFEMKTTQSSLWVLVEGKTTVGKLLAEKQSGHLGWRWFSSPVNIEKMKKRQGTNGCWSYALVASPQCKGKEERDQPVIIACSALKKIQNR